MPPNFGGYGSYSAGAGILDGINSIFDNRRESAELERQKKRQEAADGANAMNQRIGLALQRAQLNSVGIREGATPNAPTYALPLSAVGGIDTSVTDTGRYQGLGDGFYQDRNATPEFKAEQLAVKTKAQQQGAAMDRERIIGMALQDRDPASALQSLLRAGLSPSEAKTTLEASRAPEAKAPVMGTPEWEKAYRTQKRIDAEYSPRGAGGGGGAGGAGAQPGTIDTNELMKWRSEFAKQTGAERGIAEGYSRLRAATAKGVANMSPSDDIGLVYGFMKMQDPGSTVREGEYATAEQAAGVPERIVQLYNKALGGQKLTPDMRAQFLRTAEQSAKEADNRVRRVATDMVPLMTRRGVDPSEVITAPFSGLLRQDAGPSNGATSRQPIAGGDTANQAFPTYEEWLRKRGGRP